MALDAPACRADCAAYLAPVVADPSKLGCARGAACLLDCLTALVLLCRFGTAVLLPRAKVPALGRRPDVVPQAAQPVLKTRHSLGPPMLDVPASRSGREGKRDLLVALAFQT